MFIIKENFYNNPKQVRRYALSQEFSVKGNYPGYRTEPCPDPYFTKLKLEIEKILNKRISYWPKKYNTAFQYTTSSDTTWTHYDGTDWAAVVFLTPNAPTNSGTAIRRHKQTGIYRRVEGERDFNREPDRDENEWEYLDYCGNIFNRIVIYEGTFYHRSMLPGFGKDKHTGRLFQTFFFNTED